MEILNTSINEVKIIVPRVFNDDRGYFFEVFNSRALKDAGLDFTPVQENCAFSLKKRTVRGLHFQNDPVAQAKIVRCTFGSVMDYAVDLRKGSPTYLKHVSVLLSSENKKQLYLPKGFAHGVISLSDESMIEYVADHTYSPEHDRSVYYKDPQINIDWGDEDCILSPKDNGAPLLADSDCNFKYI